MKSLGTHQRKLQTQLSEKDEADVSVEIVATVAELLAKQEEKKAFNKEINADIKLLKSRLEELNQERESSVRESMIECEDRLESGVVNTYRKDTNELIDTRKPTLDELQEELPATRCITSSAVTGEPDADDEGEFDDGEDDAPEAEEPVPGEYTETVFASGKLDADPTRESLLLRQPINHAIPLDTPKKRGWKAAETGA